MHVCRNILHIHVLLTLTEWAKDGHTLLVDLFCFKQFITHVTSYAVFCNSILRKTMKLLASKLRCIRTLKFSSNVIRRYIMGLRTAIFGSDFSKICVLTSKYFGKISILKYYTVSLKRKCNRNGITRLMKLK